MFRPSALQSLLGLLVLATLLRLDLLALICALLLLTAAGAALWNRWSLVRVGYERSLNASRAFPGDEVELTVRVANRKPLPVVDLEVRDSLPAGVEVIGYSTIGHRDERQILLRSTGLRWYEQVVWRYRVRCLKRGAYRFGPVQLEGGDPFGFYSSLRDLPGQTSLLVYPRLLPLEALGLPPRHPLGLLRARQLIRDPLRTIGIRDYHPEDPLKDIHWNATARAGRLQTRVYEPTTALELAIFLDLDTFERYWEGIDEEQVESMISAAATIAQAGADEGYAVGLYVNGAPVEFESLVRLPPSRSPMQLERILETLARLTPYSVTPMPRLLRLTGNDIPWGATVLLISAIKPEATRAELLRLRETGRSVAWLYLGDDTPPQLPGILVRHGLQKELKQQEFARINPIQHKA
jgi:uncharacterized repeat protein (TIGR01451 family)